MVRFLKTTSSVPGTVKFLTLIAFAFFYFSTSAQSKKIKAANTLYENKEYVKAIEAYKAILKDNPFAPNVKPKIADCYRLTGNFSSAQKYYADVVNSTERQTMDMYNYAECLKINKNIPEAKKWYGEYVKMVPGDKAAASKLNSCSIYLDSANTIKCLDVTAPGSSMAFTSLDLVKTNVPVTFDASKIQIKGEKTTEYYWDFDDNSIGLGSTVKHLFLENRPYTVKLIITTEKNSGVTSVHCSSKTLEIKPGYKPGNNNLLDVQKQDAELREKTPKKQQ